MQIGEKSLPTQSEKKCKCDAANPNPTPIDPKELCQKGCDYYKMRAEDYESRHTCPECESHPLPDYYLGYGLKYCEKFSNETYGKLSPQGKEWLLKTRCNLQIQLEETLQNKPRIEIDGSELERYAFDMHAKAYLDAGLAELPISDLWDIGWTPEIKEWRNWATWKQAFQVTPPVVENLAGRYIKPGFLPWDYIDPEPAY
jgi:hypothetical protein